MYILAHGMYMVYTWYIPCIIFIGVPDDGLPGGVACAGPVRRDSSSAACLQPRPRAAWTMTTITFTTYFRVRVTPGPARAWGRQRSRNIKDGPPTGRAGASAPPSHGPVPSVPVPLQQLPHPHVGRRASREAAGPPGALGRHNGPALLGVHLRHQPRRVEPPRERPRRRAQRRRRAGRAAGEQRLEAARGAVAHERRGALGPPRPAHHPGRARVGAPVEPRADAQQARLRPGGGGARCARGARGAEGGVVRGVGPAGVRGVAVGGPCGGDQRVGLAEQQQVQEGGARVAVVAGVGGVAQADHAGAGEGGGGAEEVRGEGVAVGGPQQHGGGGGARRVADDVAQARGDGGEGGGEAEVGGGWVGGGREGGVAAAAGVELPRVVVGVDEEEVVAAYAHVHPDEPRGPRGAEVADESGEGAGAVPGLRARERFDVDGQEELLTAAPEEVTEKEEVEGAEGGAEGITEGPICVGEVHVLHAVWQPQGRELVELLGPVLAHEEVQAGFCPEVDDSLWAQLNIMLLKVRSRHPRNN
jgi:hypothetical protein